MKALGFQPIPLETSDIPSGLQTGVDQRRPHAAILRARHAGLRALLLTCCELNWEPLIGAAVSQREDMGVRFRLPRRESLLEGC